MMNHQEFQLYFGPDIRVQLNWTTFVSSNWPIELRYMSLPEQSDLIYTPWYASADGSPCEYNSANAKPQSIASVALNDALLACKKVLGTAHPDSLLVVPAYRLRYDSILLLDRNHRAVSAQVAASKAGLAAFIIHGPLNERVLPDLAHWV